MRLKLEKFVKSVAEDQSQPLQVRLFRLVSLQTAVICGIVVPSVNLFIPSLPLAIDLIVIGLGALSYFFHRQSCQGRHHVGLFLTAMVLALNPVWFLNAGMNGSVTYFFFTVLILPLIFYRGRLRWLAAGLMLADICGITAMGYCWPGLVVPFHTAVEQPIDLISGIFCNSVAITTVIWVMMYNYDLERNRLLQSARDLKASQERFSKAFGASPSGIAIVELDSGCYLEVNESFARLFGTTPAEITGRATLAPDIWQNDGDRRATLQPLLDGGSVRNVERRLTTRSGAVRHLLLSAELIELDGKKCAVYLIRDITERKRAEEAHARVSRRLGLIAQMSAAVLGNTSASEIAQALAREISEVFEADACVIRLLENGQLILLGASGVPLDELAISLPIFGLAEMMLNSRAPLIVPDVSSDPALERAATPAPGGFAFRAFAGVPLEARGKIVGMLGIYMLHAPREFSPVDAEHLQIAANHVAISLANDRHFESIRSKNEQLQKAVADLERAEAEIQRREKYFRLLIENAYESITVIDPRTIVIYQSFSGERVLGYPADAMVGRCLMDLVHPEEIDKARAAVDQALANVGTPVTLMVRLRHRDGSWRTIETSGTSIQAEPGGVQIIINSRDVTEKLELETQFRQSQKMEAIGQLAGGVAHDFNNILMALLMQTDLIGMTGQLPAEVREGLQQIRADTRRAADLTRRLLLFGRRQVMQSRNLDLNEIVRNLTQLLQRIIGEDVRLQLNLHPAPLFISADSGMLDQVLMNLVVNARDAMPHGGWLLVDTLETVVATDDPRLDSSLDAAPGRYVCLSVCDTGSGIPPEILPRIFEPFFTTKEAGKGTGLGLATVFGIVKQHQGWIHVANRPGQGVTFQVFLPATTQAATEPAPAVVRPRPRPGTETILLVEDEPAVRVPTRKILERGGYRVIEAPDGLEALKLWREYKNEVSLMITDLVMPGGVSGRELGRRFSAELPDLKIIYVSGYSADIAGQDFPLRPGEMFMEKPFGTEQLLETIRRCLDS